MANPKILILDIETKPAEAYVWKMFDENIGIEQLIKPSRIIAVGAKWLGAKEMFYASVNYSKGRELRGRKTMLAKVHRLMSQADAIVTFNGNKFDLPKLTGEFAEHGFSPVPPVASIDVRRTTSKMGFTSGRLAHVGPLLGSERKQKHDGFTLWADYLQGKLEARAEMKSYNLQDVKVLEQVYMKVRAFITNHPYLGDFDGACPACGSNDVQHRGRRRTRAFWIDRHHCQSCGHWSSGKRRKIS